MRYMYERQKYPHHCPDFSFGVPGSSDEGAEGVSNLQPLAPDVGSEGQRKHLSTPLRSLKS